MIEGELKNNSFAVVEAQGPSFGVVDEFTPRRPDGSLAAETATMKASPLQDHFLDTLLDYEKPTAVIDTLMRR